MSTMNQDKLGTVKVAANVLATIVKLTAESVPGVARISEHRSGAGRLIGNRLGDGGGIKIEVREDSVHADLHIIVERDVNMLKVGKRVQREVIDAVQKMVGLPVEEVNVYIQDVLD